MTRNGLRRPALAMVGMVGMALLSACSGGGHQAAAGAATPGNGMHIEITSFGPSGTNVEVDFQATNTGTVEARWEWSQYVLTAPDGSRHEGYRDPASAPYKLIPTGETYSDGMFFRFPRFTSGRYSISYAGRVLATKNL